MLQKSDETTGALSSTEMVERVANAIMATPIEEKTSDYYAMARAAIEAMRNPLACMTKAGSDARWQSCVRDPDSAFEIWNAMIDAALGK